MNPLGLLVTRGRDVRLERLGAYSAALRPIYQRLGGRHLAIGGPGRGVLAMGNTPPESAMVAAFGSLQAVRDFWWCADYRQAMALRADAGHFTVFGLPACVDVLPDAALDTYVAYAAQPEALDLQRWCPACATLLADATDFDRLEGESVWQRIAVWMAAAELRPALEAAATACCGPNLQVYRTAPAAQAAPPASPASD